ncbi:MAG: OmpW family protein [Pseudomonadales bacterium]|nr:OmpW family protein [Pseudomonadales bacterium]
MKLAKLLNTTVFTGFLVVSSQTWAHQEGDVVVGLFGMIINSELNEEPLKLTSTGFEFDGIALSIDSQSMPAVGVTYFFTDNFAIESYLGLPPRFDVDLSGFAPLDGTVASTQILAALAFLQYYYVVPNTLITLHVGVGMAYAVLSDIKVDPDLYVLDPTLSFTADNSLAGAIQLGAELNVSENMTARVTYGKMKLAVDTEFATSLLGGTRLDFSTTITIDPDLWLIGLAYEF